MLWEFKLLQTVEGDLATVSEITKGPLPAAENSKSVSEFIPQRSDATLRSCCFCRSKSPLISFIRFKPTDPHTRELNATQTRLITAVLLMTAKDWRGPMSQISLNAGRLGTSCCCEKVTETSRRANSDRAPSYVTERVKANGAQRRAPGPSCGARCGRKAGAQTRAYEV